MDNLLEWRQIREKQDRAYQESLEADRAKVLMTIQLNIPSLIQEADKQKQIERQKAEEKEHADWLQVCSPCVCKCKIQLSFV